MPNCHSRSCLSAKISSSALPLDQEAMFDVASSLLTAARMHLEPFFNFLLLCKFIIIVYTYRSVLGENSYWTLLLFIIHSEVRAIGVTRQWFFGKLYALSRSNRCVNVRPSSRAHTGALGFYAREIHGCIRAFSG